MDLGFYPFLAGLGLLTFGVVGGGMYLATRRRWPRVGRVAAWATLVLIVLSLAPMPLPAGAATLDGTVQGEGSVKLALAPDAPFSAQAGVTRAGDLVSWSCPSVCAFYAGGIAGRWLPRAGDAALGGSPTANITAGGATFHPGSVTCGLTPILFAILFPQVACVGPGCREEWTTQGTGEAPIVDSGRRLCT